jgi:hypothetical protein
MDQVYSKATPAERDEKLKQAVLTAYLLCSGNFIPKHKIMRLVDDLIEYLSQPGPVDIYFIRLIADFYTLTVLQTQEQKEKVPKIAALLLKRL